MKLEKIEQKTAKNGSPYQVLTIDGKTYGWFDGIAGLAIGDNVLCEFEQKGQYTNLVSIKKIESSQIQIVQGAKHDVVISRSEKPHSYEFGKPNNRHKVYYDNPIDLKAHLSALKELGYIDNEEAKAD